MSIKPGQVQYSPTLSFRQSAYVNLILSNWEMQLREGLLNAAQVQLLLERYFVESHYFAEFWARAAEHRDAMARRSDHTKKNEFHALAQRAYERAQTSEVRLTSARS